MKTKNRIATLAKTGMFLIILALYIEAKVNDIYENGFAAGFEMGYIQGANDTSPVWKSKHSACKMAGSRQLGQGCPKTT